MDVEGLLSLLRGHKVRFVIIGAIAFPVHGYSRATLNVDIFIEPNAANAERTRRALAEFGYDVTDISIEDLLTKKVLIRQSAPETQTGLGTVLEAEIESAMKKLVVQAYSRGMCHR